MPSKYGSVGTRKPGEAGDDAAWGGSSTSMSGFYRLIGTLNTIVTNRLPTRYSMLPTPK
jgi:hypothetical protein